MKTDLHELVTVVVTGYQSVVKLLVCELMELAWQVAELRVLILGLQVQLVMIGTKVQVEVLV